MPDFWQFPTVSMGLGPIQAIYQARFMKYLDRAWTGRRPASQGLGLPRRRRDGRSRIARRHRRWPVAKLDNLIFVINCNLQRLDGPVRGNGKIIQELEGEFRGAGWNVIKVIWGTHWDALLARDKKGILRTHAWKNASMASTRPSRPRAAPTCASIFGNTPELKAMVADWTDDEIWNSEPRRPRSVQDLRRLPTAHQANGPADRDPRQDHQGYGMGKMGRRGDEHQPTRQRRWIDEQI